MGEALITAGEVELCHETFGDAADPAILLVMGLGTQMLGWRAEFCEQLAAEGYHVIRYDNRDVGRSTHFSDHAPPTLLEMMLRRPRRPAYRLEDMAGDAAALLDALDIGSAHVVGVSMGGMIAQSLAARRPEKVRSLVSVMSTTGAGRVGQPALRVMAFLARPPALTRDAAVERGAALQDVIHSPGFERDVAASREISALSFDRDPDRRGAGRQIAAIMASGDRTASLGRITAPTLVVHGTADRMVHVSGGRATARAIPGARLELIEGMGHDLPRGLWPRLITLITEQARAADRGHAPAPASPGGT